MRPTSAVLSVGEPLVPPRAPSFRAVAVARSVTEPAAVPAVAALPLRGVPPAGRSPAPAAIASGLREAVLGVGEPLVPPRAPSFRAVAVARSVTEPAAVPAVPALPLRGVPP